MSRRPLGEYAPTDPDFDIDALLFGSKRCAECGRVLAANTEMFAPDRHEPDGLAHDCRMCRRARNRARYRLRRNQGGAP